MTQEWELLREFNANLHCDSCNQVTDHTFLEYENDTPHAVCVACGNNVELDYEGMAPPF